MFATFLLLLAAFEVPSTTTALSLKAGPAPSLWVITDNCLRVADNPCLKFARDKGSLIPVYFQHANTPKSAIKSIESKIRGLGGNLHVYDGNLGGLLDSFSNAGQEISSVFYCESPIEPARSTSLEIESFLQDRNVKSFSFSDHAFSESSKFQKDLSNAEIKRMVFRDYDYRSLKNIAFPDLETANMNIQFEQSPIPSCDWSYDGEETTSPLLTPNEDFALDLVNKYINLGEDKFTKKFAKEYVDHISRRSDEHTDSLQRLFDNKGDSALFQGEVISTFLAPQLAHGTISPNLLMHAR